VWGESQLTNADDIELEATLQQLPLNLRSDTIKTDVALGIDGLQRLRLGGGGHGEGLLGESPEAQEQSTCRDWGLREAKVFGARLSASVSIHTSEKIERGNGTV
jgi:hypothetical protein